MAFGGNDFARGSGFRGRGFVRGMAVGGMAFGWSGFVRGRGIWREWLCKREGGYYIYEMSY